MSSNIDYYCTKAKGESSNTDVLQTSRLTTNHKSFA